MNKMELYNNIKNIYNLYEYYETTNNKDKSIKTNEKEFIYDNNKNVWIPNNIYLFFSDPIYIKDNIYISNIYNVFNKNKIYSKKIKYLIGFNTNLSNSNTNSNCSYINLVLDKNLSNLEDTLNNIIGLQSRLDTKNSEKYNILLYSIEGNDIPCIIMIHYLMYKYNFSLNKAVLFVCRKIPNYKIDKKLFEIIKQKYSK